MVTLFSFCIIFVCLFHRLENFVTRKICLFYSSCWGWRLAWNCRVILALIRFIILVNWHQLRRTISIRRCLKYLLSLLWHLFLIARWTKSTRDWAIFCLITQLLTFCFWLLALTFRSPYFHTFLHKPRFCLHKYILSKSKINYPNL